MHPDPARRTALYPEPSLTRNALSNYVALGVDLLVMVLLTPLVVRSPGLLGYGMWVLAGTAVTLIAGLLLWTHIARMLLRLSVFELTALGRQGPRCTTVVEVPR